MNKCHTPINWSNAQAPAINATNLGQYDTELDTLDDRIITLDGQVTALDGRITDLANEPPTFDITLSNQGGVYDAPPVVDKTPTELAEAYAAGKVIRILNKLSQFRISNNPEWLNLKEVYIYNNVPYYYDFSVVDVNTYYPSGVERWVRLAPHNNAFTITYLTNNAPIPQMSNPAGVNEYVTDGQIVQFVGETGNANADVYIKGHFYQAHEQATTPVTFTWSEVDVGSTKKLSSIFLFSVLDYAYNSTGATIPQNTYFCLDDYFCRATADIADQAELIENTNYVKTTVGAELTRLASMI